MSDAFAIRPPWAVGRRLTERPPAAPVQGARGSAKERSQERHAQRKARRLSAVAALAQESPEQGSNPEQGIDRPDASTDAGRGRGEGRRGGRRPEGGGRHGNPGGQGGPGFGGPPMRGRRGRGGGRAKRGDVRTAILSLLAENPFNGYALIQEIEERSNGVWKPSPGAIYPALQQLEDEGLIRPIEVEDRKLFELTPAGREQVDNIGDATAPWEAVTSRSGVGTREAKHQLAQVWHAYEAVRRDGSPAQIEAASKILVDAKRSMYLILAQDDTEAPAAG
jgi:DNA-binding PadR family transcriptional regulator